MIVNFKFIVKPIFIINVTCLPFSSGLTLMVLKVSPAFCASNKYLGGPFEPAKHLLWPEVAYD